MLLLLLVVSQVFMFLAQWCRFLSKFDCLQSIIWLSCRHNETPTRMRLPWRSRKL